MKNIFIHMLHLYSIQLTQIVSILSSENTTKLNSSWTLRHSSSSCSIMHLYYIRLTQIISIQKTQPNSIQFELGGTTPLLVLSANHFKTQKPHLPSSSVQPISIPFELGTTLLLALSANHFKTQRPHLPSSSVGHYHSITLGDKKLDAVLHGKEYSW